MKRIALTHITALLCLLAACNMQQNPKQLKLDITMELSLDSIPSGSGMAVADSSVFIVGDDATGIYRLRLSDRAYQKIAMPGMDFNGYIEPKNIKHDYEAAALGEWRGNNYLLAFGSGSNNTTRDSMLIMNVADYTDTRIVSLKPFYKQAQEQTDTPPDQWNIEGAAVWDDKLVLCNRGANMILTMTLSRLMDYVLRPGTPPFPAMQQHRVKMQMIDGKEARLSGACMLDEEQVLLCASVEDTPNWTVDGPILGSVLAIYNTRDRRLTGYAVVKDKAGKVMKEKIEAVEVKSRSGNELHLLLLADDDNGKSRWMEGVMGI